MTTAIGDADLNAMIAFEEGELSFKGTLELFSRLVASGLVWSLQGFYGRTAQHFISQGWLDSNGAILREPADA